MGDNDLFRILKERPMSVSELARKLNVRREYLGGYLEALRDSGKLERVKVGRSYVYIPTHDIQAGPETTPITTTSLDSLGSLSRPSLAPQIEEEEE